jgi:hypothetical protein
MISPSNAAVTVNVYDSTGTLVGSFNTATSGSIDLSGLSPGTYSIVVVPASGAMGSLHLALNLGTNRGGSGVESDGPLPLWALIALGGGLLGIGRRAEKRRRRVA